MYPYLAESAQESMDNHIVDEPFLYHYNTHLLSLATLTPTQIVNQKLYWLFVCATPQKISLLDLTQDCTLAKT
jgi:hypothetical protein